MPSDLASSGGLPEPPDGTSIPVPPLGRCREQDGVNAACAFEAGRERVYVALERGATGAR
jgi:hypothetical protein